MANFELYSPSFQLLTRSLWQRHASQLWHNIDRRFISWGAAGWHICFDVLERLLAGEPIGRIVGADAMKFGGWQAWDWAAATGVLWGLSYFLLVGRFEKLTPVLVYTLTRIYSVEYINKVESVFEIIAEPNRRAILSLLVSSQKSVGEIERQLRMPQPTVSKHLRVLREAGFVESTVDAQRRLYRLKPGPLQELDAWLAPFRRFWSAHVDALERHLDRMDKDQSTPAKKKTRRR